VGLHQQRWEQVSYCRMSATGALSCSDFYCMLSEIRIVFVKYRIVSVRKNNELYRIVSYRFKVCVKYAVSVWIRSKPLDQSGLPADGRRRAGPASVGLIGGSKLLRLTL
jgi:hypothetical protein